MTLSSFPRIPNLAGNMEEFLSFEINFYGEIRLSRVDGTTHSFLLERSHLGVDEELFFRVR
jgi:hypothetical protein